MTHTEERMMIVGLGNPGHEYSRTRHNIGWRVLDAVGMDFHFEKKFNANVAKVNNCIYVQPMTFMNCSGEAVRAVADFYKIDPGNVIAVYDDKDIPFGVIRLRSDGSSAGHNGVQSLIQHLGTSAFARVRVGVQQTEQREYQGDTAQFVLGNFNRDEEEQLEQVIESAVGAVAYILDNGIDKTKHLDLKVFEKHKA